MAKLAEGTETPREEKRRWRTDRVVALLIFARYGVPLLDGAATDATASLAPFWVPPEVDSLLPAPWAARAHTDLDVKSPRLLTPAPLTWLNPPWGSGSFGTGAWVDRALEERAQKRIGRLLLLVPEATDTIWWWKAARVATEAVSLGRIAYLRPNGDRVGSPPQGSTLFVIDPASPNSLSALVEAARPRVSLVKWDAPRLAQRQAAKLPRPSQGPHVR